MEGAADREQAAVPRRALEGLAERGAVRAWSPRGPAGTLRTLGLVGLASVPWSRVVTEGAAVEVRAGEVWVTASTVRAAAAARRGARVVGVPTGGGAHRRVLAAAGATEVRLDWWEAAALTQ